MGMENKDGIQCEYCDDGYNDCPRCVGTGISKFGSACDKCSTCHGKGQVECKECNDFDDDYDEENSFTHDARQY